MKKSILYVMAIAFLGLATACGGDVAEEGTSTDAETTTMTEVEEQTPAPEVTDESQVEAINQWQNFVETNTGELFQVQEHTYTCDGWGGMVKMTYDKDFLRMIEHVSGGDDGGVTQKFYYDENDQLVLAWHESSMWAGDNNTTVQTMYYIKDGAPFKVLKKEAQGTSADIEQNVEMAEYSEVGAEGFEELEGVATELQGLAGDQIQAFFCN